MANTLDERSYGQGAVFGSLAYDFNNPFLQNDIPLDTAEPAVAQPAPQATVREQAAVRTAVRSKQALAPFAILGYACAAVLLIISLLARVQLTTVSDGIVSLQSELTALETEKSKLLVEYESAFNLTDVEKYATSVLGMQTPKDDQVCYVDGSSPDKAEIIVPEEDSDALKFRLSDFFGSLGEYFG